MKVTRTANPAWVEPAIVDNFHPQTLHQDPITNGVAQTAVVFRYQNKLVQINQNEVNTGVLTFDAWTSTDSGATWTLKDSGNRPAGTNLTGSWVLAPDGKSIVCAWCVNPNGPLFIKRFKMDTETWGAVESSNTPSAQQIGSITIRRNGMYVVTYRPNPDSGSRLWVTTSTDLSTWTAAQDLGVNRPGVTTIETLFTSYWLGDDDGIHFVYQISGFSANRNVVYQLYTPGNVVSTHFLMPRDFTQAGNIVQLCDTLVIPAQIANAATETGNVVMFVARLPNVAVWWELLALKVTFALDAGLQIATDGNIIVITLPIHDGTSGYTNIYLLVSNDLTKWRMQNVLDPAVDPMPPDFRTGQPSMLVHDTVPVMNPARPGVVDLVSNSVTNVNTIREIVFYWSVTVSDFGSCPQSGTSPSGGGGTGIIKAGHWPPAPLEHPVLDSKGHMSVAWAMWFNAVYSIENQES
jgi:hypothetical protein